MKKIFSSTTTELFASPHFCKSHHGWLGGPKTLDRILRQCCFLLLLLFLALPGDAQDTDPKINVSLIDPYWLKTGKEPGNSSPYLFLPDQLTIVIDLNSQGTVYYRLYTEDENTAASGLLSRGANFVIIPGDRLFLKSAQHVYTLSLKTGEKTIQKKIIIDVASDPADTLYSPLASSTEENRENPKQANKRVYEVSMFIDGRFIESRKKIIDIREKLASSTNNKEPYPILFNPRYPVPGTNPAERAMALSPFTLGFMAYKLIHDKAKANKQEKLKRRERMDTMRTPVIKRRFLKKQGLTDKIEVNVTISLEVLE